MSSLEDDVELGVAASPQPEPAKRKLSRLKKARGRSEEATEAAALPRSPIDGEDTPEAAAARADADAEDAAAENRSGAGSDADAGVDAAETDAEEAAEDDAGGESDAEGTAGTAGDYWDEEDELADDFRRELAGGNGDTPAPSGTVQGGEEEEDGGGSVQTSPGGGAHLNAQTQRMLRESAVRDRIGKGHNVDIVPLSGILAKLKAQRQAVIARTKPAPMRQAPPPPPLVVEEEEIAAEDAEESEEILLISDEDEEAPAAAVASTQSATQAAAEPTAFQLDMSQELQLNLGSASSEGGRDTAAFSQPSLHLMLETQTQASEWDDPAEPPPATVPVAAPAAAANPPAIVAPAAMPAAAAEVTERPEEAPVPPAKAAAVSAQASPASSGGGGGGEVSGEDDEALPAAASEGSSGNEGSDDEGGAVSGGSGRRSGASGAASSSSSGSDSDSESEEEEVEAPQMPAEGGEAAKAEVAAAASGATTNNPAAAAALAAAKAKLHDGPGDFFKSDFFDMEAEMSDDEGHSSDGGDDDANADGMLAELIGTGSEKKRDAKRREKLHAQWLAAQDASDMEAVVAAMKAGWRRPGRRGGLDGDLGTDREARRRRAALMGVTEEELDAGTLDLAALFPGLRPRGSTEDGGGSGDEEEAAEEAAALKDAERQRLLDASQELDPEEIMEGCSEETLGLLSRGGSGSASAAALLAAPPSQRSRLGLFGSELTNMPPAAGSFLGHTGALGSTKVQRGGSEHTNGGGRSYVFGCRGDDSNSGMPGALPPTEDTSDLAAMGPTSFAGVRGIAAAAAGARKPKRKAASGLLGMLSKTAGDGGGKNGKSASLAGASKGMKRAKPSEASVRALGSLFKA